MDLSRIVGNIREFFRKREIYESFFGKRLKFSSCNSREVYFFLAKQRLDNSWGFLDTVVASFYDEKYIKTF